MTREYIEYKVTGWGDNKLIVHSEGICRAEEDPLAVALIRDHALTACRRFRVEEGSAIRAEVAEGRRRDTPIPRKGYAPEYEMQGRWFA